MTTLDFPKTESTAKQTAVFVRAAKNQVRVYGGIQPLAGHVGIFAAALAEAMKVSEEHGGLAMFLPRSYNGTCLTIDCITRSKLKSVTDRVDDIVVEFLTISTNTCCICGKSGNITHPDGTVKGAYPAICKSGHSRTEIKAAKTPSVDIEQMDIWKKRWAS